MSGPPLRSWRLGSLDWTRPHGVPFDRSQLPPDDEITDVAAWLAERFETLAADEFCLRGGADRLADPTRTAAVGSATTERE